MDEARPARASDHEADAVGGEDAIARRLGDRVLQLRLDLVEALHRRLGLRHDLGLLGGLVFLGQGTGRQQ